MPITVSIELSDIDLEHFKAMADAARVRAENLSRDDIVAEARKLFEETGKNPDIPEFVGTRLSKLEVLVNMVTDSEWQLSDEDVDRVTSAMAYFAAEDDLIPDKVPGLGFLDDALMVELITANFDTEISAYQEFCQYRIAEERRREARGEDPHVGREEWLAAKRSALKSRMRKRRSAMFSGGSGATGGSWRVSLW